MRFLDNPRHRHKFTAADRAKAKRARRSKSGTKRKRRRAAPAVRHRRPSTTKESPMARRRKRGRKRAVARTTRRRTHAAAPRARRRSSGRKRSTAWRKRAPGARRYTYNRSKRRVWRTNPSIVGTLKQALGDGVAVTGGRAAFNALNGLIPFGGSPITDILKGAAVVVGVGMLSRKALGGERARMVTAGAASSLVAALVKSFAPQFAGYLGDDYGATYGVGDGEWGVGPGGTAGVVGSFPGAGFTSLGDLVSESPAMGSYPGSGY